MTLRRALNWMFCECQLSGPTVRLRLHGQRSVRTRYQRGTPYPDVAWEPKESFPAGKIAGRVAGPVPHECARGPSARWRSSWRPIPSALRAG